MCAPFPPAITLYDDANRRTSLILPNNIADLNDLLMVTNRKRPAAPPVI